MPDTMMPISESTPSRTVGSMICLCEAGDVKVAWDAENDEAIRAGIAAMLEKGFVFHIVQATRLGRERLVRLRNLEHLTDRRLVVKDEDIQKLFDAGLVTVRSETETEFQSIRPARTVDDVVKNDTVRHPQPRGG